MLAKLLVKIANLEAESHWTVLKPGRQNLKSEGGATLALPDDGSILASGKNPIRDVISFIGHANVKRLAALRIEALTHESLPNQGTGRRQRDAGNFGQVEKDGHRL